MLLYSSRKPGKSGAKLLGNLRQAVWARLFKGCVGASYQVPWQTRLGPDVGVLAQPLGQVPPVRVGTWLLSVLQTARIKRHQQQHSRGGV